MTRTFEEWKQKVEKEIVKRTLLSPDDLPDCPYYDWYEARVEPKTAAIKALREAGF